MLVLIWVYYSAQLVLFGAEFTAVYAQRYGSRRAQGSSRQSSAAAREHRQSATTRRRSWRVSGGALSWRSAISSSKSVSQREQANGYHLDHHHRLCGWDHCEVPHAWRKNEPSGFILTTLLGVVGAFVATYLGQALGWYQANEGAGLFGAVVGAIIVLAIWGFIARSRSAV